MSLDDLFAGKASGRRSAQDIFTDRTDQADAFAESLRVVRTASANPGLISDLGGPRWNVLSFYGMGGIGKSTLARELERRLLNGDFSPPKAATRSLVVDLGAGRDRNFEELLLRLRAELADLGPWRAFDLAFATYWEERHPGVALHAIPDHHARLRKAGEVWGVGDQIQSTIEAVIDGSTFGLLGVGRRLGTLAMRQVVGRINERRLLEECPLFEQITSEGDYDQVLAYLPHLLAWDLHRAQRKRLADGNAADVVVFLDTWEEIQRGSSGRGSLEDLVARMVYLMPNVVFVVLGRDRLDWAAEHRGATLAFGGPACWPGLTNGVTREPTQHLLGGLDPEDRAWFLAHCRQVDGEPAIPGPVREAIAVASDGLPYFLDLAADYFDELREQGIDPTPEHFAVPFPELVGRVFRDLPPAERNLLSAASVAGSFDSHLLAHLVPQALPSDIDRFLTRNFVHGPMPGWLPFRIHDRLRESVVAYRNPFQDTWSDERWTEARISAATWIVDSVLAGSRSGVTGADDRARALILVSVILRESGDVPRQLPLLLWRVQQAGDLPALLEVEGRLEGSGSETVDVLRIACRAALRSLRTDAPIAPEEVARGWRSAPTAELRDVLGLYLGDIRDVAADMAGAEDAFRSVSSATPEFTLAATRLQAAVLLRRSRFRDAMEVCMVLPGTEPAERAAHDSLRGMIHYWSAQFELASDVFEASLRTAIEAHLRLWAARSARHKYLALAWGALGEADDLRRAAIELNEAVGSEIGLAQIDAAHALHRTREGDVAGGARLLDSSLERLTAKEAHSDILMVLACKVAWAVLAGDPAQARDVHELLLKEWRSVDTGPLWPCVSGVLSGSSLEGLEEPQWLEGSNREGWLRVLGRR